MTNTDWKPWVGRAESHRDLVTTTPVAAALGRDDPSPAAGDRLPPLRNWSYLLPLHRQSELGQDGHAKRGGSLATGRAADGGLAMEASATLG
jgi:3-methylfumaryl-CoA hydratase